MAPAASLSVTDAGTHLCDVSVYPALGALRNSRWFGGLSASTLAQLARSACIRSFSTRQQVELEGRWLGAAALVVRGCICALRKTDGSRELTLEVFLAGDIFADALVDPDSTRSSDSLVAAETSVLLLLPRQEFLAVTRTMPEVALALGARVRAALEQGQGSCLGACHDRRGEPVVSLASQIWLGIRAKLEPAALSSRVFPRKGIWPVESARVARLSRASWLTWLGRAF